jgi:2-oxoglutarate dehydrogenase E2 component (dihydrolipoamide succinyltransferase)
VAAGGLVSGTVSGGTVSVTGSAGITRFAGGIATLAGPATIGTMASGSVTLSGSTATITTLSGGRVVLGGAAVTVSGGTFTGTLSGSTGSLTKTGPGTLALAGMGSLSAPTSVRGGILRLDDANALSASSVTPLAGGTLTGIARRLKEAQSTAAMLTTFNEVDMSAVMHMRNQYKDQFEKRHGVKLRDAVESTLLHEAGHAYVDSSGMSGEWDDEEDLVEEPARVFFRNGDIENAARSLREGVDARLEDE